MIDKDEKRVKKFFSKALKAAVEDGELIKEKASYLPRRACGLKREQPSSRVLLAAV